MNALKYSTVSLLAVMTVLAAWWVAGTIEILNPLLLPSPQHVLLAGYDLLTDGYRGVSLAGHIMVSVARAMSAFVVASVIGVMLGLAMGLSPVLNAVVDPFVQFLRPIPKLALIPLVIVWFGIGEFSKFLLIFLATFLTVVMASAAAVQGVPTGRVRAARALGVTRWQLFRYVVLPSTLPELFTAVRAGIGIGWTTLIAAEMIASTSGVGWMVMNASSYLRTDVVMVGILILGGVGYCIDLLLVTAQRHWVHWVGK
jgi:taurine transport system permease protein